MRCIHVKRAASGVLLSATLLLPLAPAQAAAVSAAQTPQTIPAKDAAVSQKLAAVQPANAKLNKEQALAIAKSYVQLPAGAELVNSSFRDRDSWRTFPEWSFYWVKKDENGREEGPSINVSVNADSGELTSYNYWENKRSEGGQPIERAAAAKIAEQFLTRHAAAKASQVRLYERNTPNEKPPLGNQVTYGFLFLRVVNGTLFPDNEIRIEVDHTGRVVNYHLNWNDNITFAEADELISEEQAAEAFQAAARAKPTYTLSWEQPGQRKPFLVYQNPFDFLVDAETGQPLNHTLEQLPPEQEPVPVANRPLRPHHSGGSLTQEEAVKLAGKLLDLSGYELESVNYYEDEMSSGGVWGLHYASEDRAQGDSKYLSVSLDAKTGDVLSYYQDRVRPLALESDEAKKVDWSEEEIKERAIAALQKYSPTIASQLYATSETLRTPEQDERISVYFYRLLDGIQAATGSATITFNLREGEIESYNVHMGNETYPAAPPRHVSAAEAVSAWWDEAQLELIYAVPPVDHRRVKFGQAAAAEKRSAKLVYRVTTTPYEEPYAYHAETGEWVSLASGKTISLHREKPSDIAGHPAEKQLTLMYEYDAISPIDGKLLPDKPITRGEMIKMLMITLNNGRFYAERYAQKKATFADVAASSPYFAYVEAAAEQGLLGTGSGNLKPDEPITRRELADMLVRALGLHKLADYDSLFASNVTDVAADERGTIAIVTTLGIMSAENGEFKPAQLVSRANAAIAFSRFLEKRNELSLGSAPYNMY